MTCYFIAWEIASGSAANLFTRDVAFSNVADADVNIRCDSLLVIVGDINNDVISHAYLEKNASMDGVFEEIN